MPDTVQKLVSQSVTGKKLDIEPYEQERNL